MCVMGVASAAPSQSAETSTAAQSAPGTGGTESGGAKEKAEVSKAPSAATTTKPEMAGALSAKAPSAKADLPNFHQTAPFLYRGGEPTERGLNKLKSMGVGTIVDLRGHGPVTEAEQKYVRKLGMDYINLPMDSSAPSKQTVETFLKAVEDAKEKNGKGPVFVHCQHGSDRTGCLVGVWRVTHDKWTYPQAYEEMRKYWFTPKFTNLSGTVKRYATDSDTAAHHD